MTNRSQKVKEKREKIILSQKYSILPGGESNPGLPRDRRGYSPLYYRGFDALSRLRIFNKYISRLTGSGFYKSFLIKTIVTLHQGWERKKES